MGGIKKGVCVFILTFPTNFFVCKVLNIQLSSSPLSSSPLREHSTQDPFSGTDILLETEVNINNDILHKCPLIIECCGSGARIFHNKKKSKFPHPPFFY